MTGKARYHSAHLHLHSCFESSASMGGHCHEARRVGVDVVWITDHDSRICWKEDDAFWRDDFEGEELSTPYWKGGFHGWQMDQLGDGMEGKVGFSKRFHLSGNQSMRVWARSRKDGDEWSQARLDFSTAGKKHQRSLMTGVSINLGLRPQRGFGENGRLRIRVGLSQQPPEMDPEQLTYVFGEGDGGEGLIVLDPLKLGGWNRIHLDLTEDATRHARGGVDNVFGTLSLILDSRRGELVELYVDDFHLEQELKCQNAFDRQKVLASEFSDRYGVTVHIGTELSRSGYHKNAFGSWIPILDRNSRSEGFSEEEAVQHVRAHGGALSINHPFARWKREDLNAEGRKEVVREVTESYRENSCHGADLIEVGFPDGRHGFSLDHYLKLWDGLSSSGVLIAGIGVSDAHSNGSGWESGNNFVNWIRSDTKQECDLIRGMLLGDIYMSDPTRFKGDLEFATEDGVRMGRVLIGSKKAELSFRMNGCRPGWEVHWIVNGTRKEALQISGQKFKSRITVPVDDFGFVRCEVYDGERCILLTNPIYLAEDVLPESVKERIVECNGRISKILKNHL